MLRMVSWLLLLNVVEVGKKKRQRKNRRIQKKLIIPKSEISKCPDHELKQKLGKIFVNNKMLEEYSVNPISHRVFLTFVIMTGEGRGGGIRLPSLCSLDWQIVEICWFEQQVIHLLWTKCHFQIFADVIVLLVTLSWIKDTYRNSQFFTYLHGASYFCMRLIFFSFFIC